MNKRLAKKFILDMSNLLWQKSLIFHLITQCSQFEMFRYPRTFIFFLYFFYYWPMCTYVSLDLIRCHSKWYSSYPFKSDLSQSLHFGEYCSSFIKYTKLLRSSIYTFSIYLLFSRRKYCIIRCGFWLKRDFNLIDKRPGDPRKNVNDDLEQLLVENLAQMQKGRTYRAVGSNTANHFQMPTWDGKDPKWVPHEFTEANNN